MRLYRLVNKGVLRVLGKAEEFVKAYSTHTPDQPFTAFVDLHGKIVAACHQVRTKEGEILLVLGKPFLDRLKKHLGKYLPLSDAEIREENTNVYLDLEENDPGKLILTAENPAAPATEEE